MNDLKIKLSGFQWLLALTVLSFTFIVWFSLGVYQPINPDSYKEMGGIAYDARMPLGLISDYHQHRSRWFADTIGYGFVHAFMPLWSIVGVEIAEGLSLTQGFMVGFVGLWFCMISAYYACGLSLANINKYFLGIVLFCGFLVASHTIVWVWHISVFNHYVGSTSLLLTVMAPVWRYWVFNANKLALKTSAEYFFYFGLILVAFSTSAITILCIVFSAITLLYMVVYKKNKGILFPLLFLLIACTIALFFELGSGQGARAKTQVSDLFQYLRVWVGWWVVDYDHVGYNIMAPALKNVSILVIACALFYINKISTQEIASNGASIKRVNNGAAYIFFVIICYSFVVGGTKLPYRYDGWNLGEDVLLIFYAWFLILLVFVLLNSLPHTLMRVVLPVASFVAVSNMFWMLGITDGLGKASANKQKEGFRLMAMAECMAKDDVMLLPKYYVDVLSPWGYTHTVLAEFAYRVGIVKRVYKISFIDDKEYLSHQQRLAGHESVVACK